MIRCTGEPLGDDASIVSVASEADSGVVLEFPELDTPLPDHETAADGALVESRRVAIGAQVISLAEFKLRRAKRNEAARRLGQAFGDELPMAVGDTPPPAATNAWKTQRTIAHDAYKDTKKEAGKLTPTNASAGQLRAARRDVRDAKKEWKSTPRGKLKRV